MKKAVDAALELLSHCQMNNGGYASVDGACSESAAQVIVALTSLGINPHTDERFVKNGRSVVDGLCDYYAENGGFKHIASGNVDGMATEQAYYALTAYIRLIEEKTSLYDMSDVTIHVPETCFISGLSINSPVRPATSTRSSANILNGLSENIMVLKLSAW